MFLRFTPALLSSNAKAAAAAVLVAATAVVIATTMTSGGGQVLTPSVSIVFGSGQITVTVKLPGPSYYSYAYTTYTSYTGYSYATYTSYTSPAYSGPAYYTPIPVKVIVVVETTATAPEMVAYKTLDLEAYGQNNTATVTFTGLEAGSYRVKVMFWNDLLSRLAETGGLWKPFASPVTKEGYVS